MSDVKSPMHRLKMQHRTVSSPLSPYTYRWPEEQVSEVVQKAQFLELVRHSGWLLKQHGNGPHPRWSRKWSYLLDDRLCFTAEPGKVDDVRYIPLDRIPVRALPRGYGPQIGVTVVEDRQIDKKDLGQSGRRRACVFSVQCGTHTHVMAAETAADAELWVDRITQTWVHCSKYTGRSIRARNLEDSFVHTQQHLLHENAVLRLSLDELQQAMQAEQASAHDRPQTLSRGTSAAINTINAQPVPPADAPNKAPIRTQQSIQPAVHAEPPPAVQQQQQQQAGLEHSSNPWEQWKAPAAFTPEPQQAWDSSELPQEWSGSVTELVTYELELDTGQQEGGGTTAHVALELFGLQRGKPCTGSGEHRLDQGPHQPIPFAEGQTDAFEIRCAELGDLTMVPVSHDNSGTSPGWSLEEVRARRKGTRHWVHFYCGRWLAKTKDDGAISRELRREERPRKVQYHVAVATSDVRGASTSADVHITLHGEQSSGVKHDLNGGPEVFNRGSTSDFTIYEHELGNLSHVTIGHNSAGSSSSWHVESVMVTHVASGQQWRFSCGRWFDLHQDDGLTERDLFPGRDEPVPIWYSLTTFTSNIHGAGTDADVFVTIYGRNGTSPRLRLPSKGNDFCRGSTDVFRMQLQSVGDVMKLTVGHDNKGRSSDWHLDQAELTDESTGTTYYFACQRWFSLHKDDGLIERDLWLSSEKPHGQQMSYLAEVHTSDVRGAGTDADVSIMLFGDLGDSGLQPLNGDDAFARAAVDIFRFSCNAVGEMHMLRVSHSGIGRSPDWHLEKVVITEESSGNRAVFRCNDWLSDTRGEKSTSRDLYLSDDISEHISAVESESAAELTPEPSLAPIAHQQPSEPQQTSVEYQIWVHTSGCKGAGTEDSLSVELHGQQCSSGVQRLQPKQGQSFSKGQVADFALQLAPLGHLQQLTLLAEGTSWRCEMVVVEDTHLDETWYFLYDRWLGQKNEREVQLKGCKQDPRAPFHDYHVTVITSDLRNAGTDGDVILDIQGEQSSSGPQHLHAASQQTFDRGMTDDFDLRLRHLGPLHQATVVLEGSAAAWHLELIIIMDNTTGERYPADARYLLGLSYPSSERQHALTFQTLTCTLGVTSARWFFPCNSWLGKDAGWSTLLPTQLTDPRNGASHVDYQAAHAGLTFSQFQTSHMFQVVTYTSDLRGAGSEATVFARLRGEQGTSPRCSLIPADREASSFSRGQKDVFQLQLPELGTLQSLTIGHDNKGEHPAWHLELVEVTHLPSGTTYYFPCYRWFNSTQDDQLIVRTLEPQEFDPRPKAHVDNELTEYEVTMHTADVQDAATDADVFLVLYSATGESKPLHIQAPPTAFARNKSDTFLVKGPWVGPLTQLRVGHNGRGPQPDWMLDWVRIKHCPTGQEWVFFAHKWLYSGNNNEVLLKPGSLTRYSLKVYTSDVPQSMAYASGFAQLHGPENSSQTIMLPKQDRMSFQPGTEDVWTTAEMQDVGDLQRLTLGLHEPASDRTWHVTLVEVTCLSSKTVWSFPCHRWFGLQSPGGLVERQLFPAGSANCLQTSLTDYRVSLEALPGALPMQSQPCLWMQMHGPDGLTQPLPFHSTQGVQSEAFDCTAEAVGPLIHLTVWLEPLQESNGPWHLQGIEVLDKSSGRTFFFPCSHWLDTAGKARSKLQLGPRPPSPTPPLQPLAVPEEEEQWQPELREETAETVDRGVGGCYTVVIHGSSLPEGLWVDLEGLAGTSGPQDLNSPSPEPQQVTFPLQTLGHLGPLTQLTLGHTQASQGWLLDRVEVTDEGTGLLYLFFCGESIDANTSRTMQVAGSAPPPAPTPTPPALIPAPLLTPQISLSPARQQSLLFPNSTAEPAVTDNTVHYTVTISTSDLPGAGTDCTAYIVIYGADENTGKRALEAAEGRFLRGSVQACQVAGLHVSKMTHVCIGHNDDGIESAWHLEKVQVLNGKTGELVTFKCRAWLDATSEDGLIEREFYPMTECSYKLELQTSDKRGAGTSANGVISLIGTLAEAGPVQLVNNGNSFQRGQLDELIVEELPDVGHMQQVEVGHDGEGSHAAWHLAWVRVTNLDTTESATFQCNRWLQQMGGLEEAPIINYMQSATVDPIEQMQTLQQPQLAQAHMAQSQGEDEGSEGVSEDRAGGYRLTFNTSPPCFSGTNSQVYFELIGSVRSSGVMVPAATKKSFRPGGCDIFTYPQMPCVGDPLRMRIFTDGAGLFPGWHLRDVDMLHLATNIRYVFGCHNWIDKRCKHQRVLDLELVQPPPMQPQDWRITQVLPQYTPATSPFRPRYDAKTQGASPTTARQSRQGTPRHAHQRLSFQQDQVQQQSQPYSESNMQLQTQPYVQPQQPQSGLDARLDVHQKLQRDFEHYKQIGKQKSLASPVRQQSSLASEPMPDDSRGIGILGKRLQAAQSIARRNRLQHQQTAEVVPRFDSVQYSRQAKQSIAQSADVVDRMQYVGQSQQPIAEATSTSGEDSRQYGEQSEQPFAASRQGRRLNARTQSIVPSAPPLTNGRRSPGASRHSPSRFANRTDQSASPPGLAKSQRISAWRV